MKVVFTESARDQFSAGIRYVHERNPKAAKRIRDACRKSLTRLERFPMSGRYIPEFPDLPYRELIHPPYRFFYRIDERADTVWVVAVWHDSQLPDEPEE